MSPLTVLGVDDFAVKRGHHYGTVLVDCQTGQAVDLLLGRDADPLADWLRAHPKPVVICRDRATAYAEGAATGAPEAEQVADRFHLWQNLAAAVERTVIGHKKCLDEPAAPTTETSVPPLDEEPTGAMAERRKANHALVGDLVAQGASFRHIARHLGWSQRTVAQYAHATTWQELMVDQKPRPSLLDPFIPYLRERIGHGCLHATRLHREVTARGFTGGYGIVRAFVEQHRMRPDLERVRRPPSVRQVTGWICRHPDNLVEGDSECLQAILDRCPKLTTTAIARFATGLTNDLAAVTAGLSQPHSSGAGRGQRQPDQDAQTTDVWPRQLRSTPQTRPPRALRDSARPHCSSASMHQASTRILSRDERHLLATLRAGPRPARVLCAPCRRRLWRRGSPPVGATSSSTVHLASGTPSVWSSPAYCERYESCPLQVRSARHSTTACPG
jgi:hypothetical protein